MVDDRRVAIVTGASRGIGLACASALSTSGSAVVGLSRSIPSDPGEIDHRALDVCDAVAVDDALAQIELDYGRLDILVANAGITSDQLSIKMTDDQFTEVIDTNLTATFRIVRRCLRRMVRQRHGRIVVVSSIGALMGLPGQANYAASKAGLIGMARAMAREVATRDITINVVAPGLIDTDMTEALGPDRLNALVAQIPASRLGTPQDVAHAVTFLTSREASYVTGAIIAVDGGLGMGL